MHVWLFSDISNWRISDYFLLIYTKVSGKDDECPKEPLYSSINFVLLKLKGKAFIYFDFWFNIPLRIRDLRTQNVTPNFTFSKRGFKSDYKPLSLRLSNKSDGPWKTMYGPFGSLLRSVFKLQTYLSELFQQSLPYALSIQDFHCLLCYITIFFPKNLMRLR